MSLPISQFSLFALNSLGLDEGHCTPEISCDFFGFHSQEAARPGIVYKWKFTNGRKEAGACPQAAEQGVNIKSYDSMSRGLSLYKLSEYKHL